MAAIPLFGHTKIPHRLLETGSAALAAAVALPRQGDPNFPQWINEVLKKIYKKRTREKEDEREMGEERERKSERKRERDVPGSQSRGTSTCNQKKNRLHFEKQITLCTVNQRKKRR